MRSIFYDFNYWNKRKEIKNLNYSTHKILDYVGTVCYLGENNCSGFFL